MRDAGSGVKYADRLPYASAATIRRAVAEAIRAPKRQTVVETAKESMRVKGPGGRYEPWSAGITPYMVEPAELLTSRVYDAVVFVGPARTGKTAIIDAWIAHALAADTADFCVVHMTQDTARDYSLMRLKRIIDNSPDLKRAMSPHAREDNVFDKFGRAGQVIKIAWPTITQLSGKEFRWVAATDYDRVQDDIDGEGDLFGILLKRVTTFLSAGMGYFESSPGRDFVGGNWKPATPHEAPPVTGIIGLYNQGDRRRFYWPCLHCDAEILVDSRPEQFQVAPLEDLQEIVLSADLTQMSRDAAIIACPECGAIHRQEDRRTLNARGEWRRERDSRIASFWLGGPAAAYQSWHKLVLGYLEAVKHYAVTGDEEPLRRSITQDFGGAYQPLSTRSNRATAEDLQDRVEIWTERQVPQGVRFLIATVDVQKNRFVVQITGFGQDRQRWVVDRYNLALSERTDHNGEGLKVDPAAYPEDWDLLLKLITKSYPLSDGSGHRMPMRLTLCDLGGADGVSTNAYNFWRRAKKKGHGRRFMLVRGASAATAPRWEVRYPDTRKRSDRNSNSAGDVPVLFVNTNLVKDALANDLKRTEPGPGYYHFPRWLGDWFFRELTREQRTEKGWSQKSGNEAWDLAVYADAAAGYEGIEKMNWDTPKPWAATWDENPYIIRPETDAPEQQQEKPKPRPARAIRARMR